LETEVRGQFSTENTVSKAKKKIMLSAIISHHARRRRRREI
jgi:hypothetical protein